MKIIKKLIIILIAIGFVLIPLPKADLYLRVHFMAAEGQSCALYYTTQTSNVFSAEQLIQSDIDYELNQVTFKLDSSLADELTGLRFDFPNTQTLVCINNITVSSAGVIQKQFNPCEFFSPENIVQTNDIPDMSLVKPKNRAYFQTGSTDPHVVLSGDLVSEIADGYSSYTMTRVLICIFAAAVYFMYKKNLFSKSK